MIDVRIVGGKGKDSTLSESHVHPFETAGGHRHHGQVTLSHPFLNLSPELHPFLNTSFGTAMNQDVTFGGSGLRATVIHAGVNSGSAIAGTTDAGPSANKLVDASGGFNAAVGPGAVVHNTTAEPDEYAVVTAVDSDTQLSLDADIMDAGSEAFVINDIWPGTIVAGTWNFADSAKFTITSANNNDEATFTVDSSHVWKMTHFVSFTGKVDLDTYDEALDDIILEFGLNGTLVGNTVNLNDFIDTGDFAEQTFVIPKTDLGLSDQTINSMRITILRTAGAKPTIKFDDFQWENTGTPLVFKATTPIGTRFHVTEIRVRIDDALTAVLTDGSMPNIDPGAILGVSSLANGMVFQRVEDGKTLFSFTLKNLGDFFATGSDAINITGNGTNQGLTLVVAFSEPIILKGGSENNFLSFTVNDDMTNLTRLTAVARGALEI